MVERRVVVMGVSAAGKTSVGVELAHRLHVRFVDADDLHPPANVAKMAGGKPLNDADRHPWLGAVASCLREPQGVVVACSALKRAYRDQLRGDETSPVTFVLLDVPRDVLEQRIEARTGHFMPPSLLDDQLATLEPPEPDETDVVVVTSAGSVASVAKAAAAVLGVS